VPPHFDRDTAVERVGAGRYAAVIGAHWRVGRGPNGGFVGALALNAAAHTVADDRPPCSVTVHFVTPAQAGPIEITVEEIRAGRMVTHALVRMHQAERAVALGLVAFTAPRATSEGYDDTVFPDAPRPDSLTPVPPGIPGIPPFLANYDVRFAIGHLIASGGPEATAGVWIRTAEPRVPDAVAVTAFADAWAPSPWIRQRVPAPAPTIDSCVHFRDHAWYERARAEDFVLAVFRSRLLAHGLFEEDGELWSPDGVLLAQSRQLGMLLA
jgi:acyl-CoA thioesterase